MSQEHMGDDDRDGVTRRWVTRASGCTLAGVFPAGCVSGDDDSSDTPTETSGSQQATDSGSSDTSNQDAGSQQETGSDSSDTASENGGFQLNEEFDSYISETRVVIEDQDGDVENHEYGEWDVANDRAYTRHTWGDPEEAGPPDGPTIEYTLIDNQTYQRYDDGSCELHDAPLLTPDVVGSVELPYSSVPESEYSTFEHVGTDTVNGVAVDRWEIDFDDIHSINIGEMTLFVAQETNYLVRTAGWYSHRGDREIGPAFVFTQDRHSFNEPLDIKPPEDC